jgi:predicted  nucleic acid-binding Zn-ribbon protein
MPRRQVKPKGQTIKPIESQEKKLAKWNKLKLEYDSLKAERAKLRDEITGLDRRVSNGDISKKQRDKEFRAKLAGTSEISRKIAQVIREMARLGKIPEDYPGKITK